MLIKIMVQLVNLNLMRIHGYRQGKEKGKGEVIRVVGQGVKQRSVVCQGVKQRSVVCQGVKQRSVVCQGVKQRSVVCQ